MALVHAEVLHARRAVWQVLLLEGVHVPAVVTDRAGVLIRALVAA